MLTDEAAVDLRRSVAEAVERFLTSHGVIDPIKGFRGKVEYGTFRKYRNSLKPNEVVPYTLQEESLIPTASEQIGGKYNRAGESYEQLRARAMIMLLRVSDVSTLQREAVSWDEESKTWRVRVRTQKSGEPVFLPIPEPLELALDALLLPRNAARDCLYYFRNAQTSRRSVVGIAERTLAAVFRKSGVKDAHVHCFRHKYNR